MAKRRGGRLPLVMPAATPLAGRALQILPVHGAIDAGAAIEVIVAEPAREAIVGVAAHKLVGPSRADEQVHLGTALQDVGAEAANKGVVAARPWPRMDLDWSRSAPGRSR
jgi:hypothetical protein